MRKTWSIFAVFVMTLLSLSMVSAVGDLEIINVRVNDIEFDFDDPANNNFRLAVNEGEDLDVEIVVRSQAGVKDVEVDARISGYEYSDYDSLSDATHLFDVEAGTARQVETLRLTLPNRLDRAAYDLRLRALSQTGNVVVENIELFVEAARHGIEIADVAFSPGNTVHAGRSLLTTVLVENYGKNTEKDVKVTVEIPALGVSATEFVDVVDHDGENIDQEDVPEMFLPIPATAAEGDYDVVVTARYDDHRELSSWIGKVHVVADQRFSTPVQDTLVLAVGPENQNVAAGKTASYAVALTNPAGCVSCSTSKAYALEVVAGDWASQATVSESLVVLEPGKNKVVYVEITAANDAAGQNTATLLVKSGSEVLETIPLRANVDASQASGGSNVNLRNGLEIALIVLVVLLVIIGLIIGFSRLSKDDDSGEDQTYY